MTAEPHRSKTMRAFLVSWTVTFRDTILVAFPGEDLGACSA